MTMLVPKYPRLNGFRSASEETAGKVESNEGGHMSYSRGRVVRTPGSSCPYKAILTQHCGQATERAFATMRDAEAFIRRNTPVPLPRSTLFDRAADDA